MGECAAFQIGPVVFHWYGVLVVLAIIAGLITALLAARCRGQETDTVYNLALVGVPAGIMGARLYYVAAHWSLYAANLSEILAIEHGGLAFEGTLLGSVLACFLYLRLTGKNFWLWADVCTPGLLVGQAIGWGASFINQEAFGYPTTSSWGIYIDYNLRPPGYEGYDYFTPVVIYEFLWDVAALVLILVVARVWRRFFGAQGQGLLFISYMTLSLLGRVIIDPLRLDRGAISLTPFTATLGILLLLGLAALLLWQRCRQGQQGITI